MNHLIITSTQFYSEEFRRKTDAEKYRAKGTCEVSIEINDIEMSIKNITYRIDHSGKIQLKPPYRIHSNKKAGIKPKLVPSVVFKNVEIWLEIERYIKKELVEFVPQTRINREVQLMFLEKIF